MFLSKKGRKILEESDLKKLLEYLALYKADTLQSDFELVDDLIYAVAYHIVIAGWCRDDYLVTLNSFIEELVSYINDFSEDEEKQGVKYDRIKFVEQVFEKTDKEDETRLLPA